MFTIILFGSCIALIAQCYYVKIVILSRPNVTCRNQKTSLIVSSLRDPDLMCFIRLENSHFTQNAFQLTTKDDQNRCTSYKLEKAG